MDSYSVVVYLNAAKKMFAVTGRKPGPTLIKMNKHMKEEGFDVQQVGQGLSKETKDVLKEALVLEYAARGNAEQSMTEHIGQHFGKKVTA